MPDHWHGLIELGQMDSLSALAGRIKGATARSANAARGERRSVWTDGFHDHAIRAEEDLVDIARYIILNPVRAGLVNKVGLYPFWDAIWIDEGLRG
jgi:REP element-mobilizing transposase RayT